MARLKEKYYSEIMSAVMESEGIKNKMACPKLEKIVINMGVGKAIENKKRLESAVQDLGLITGQKPVVTKARKSIAGFKLREDVGIGCKATLRGNMMYEFLDRLITVIIPRIRDFRGFSKTAFDQGGSYTLGLQEQSFFPEIDLDKLDFYQGMNITFVIKNSNKKISLELLKLFGFPFKREEKKN
ncbi:50S ribosomal protein L5 [Candidatus Uabimicrobium sp. HlEnr_7]|uniref:50S ribosomal protein L5 n=1 Tax=Candidatus Uabimicrobium helgolandensis TaxID=3095367 RepID=UPI003556C397